MESTFFESDTSLSTDCTQHEIYQGATQVLHVEYDCTQHGIYQGATKYAAFGGWGTDTGIGGVDTGGKTLD